MLFLIVLMGRRAATNNPGGHLRSHTQDESPRSRMTRLFQVLHVRQRWCDRNLSTQSRPTVEVDPILWTGIRHS